MSGAWDFSEALGMLPLPVVSQHGGQGHMDVYRHMMSFWGDGVIGGIILLVIVGTVIFFLARNLGSSHADDTSADETPLEILKKRYARGEITRDEYETMRDSLQDQDPPCGCCAGGGSAAAGGNTYDSMGERKERHGSHFPGDIG